MNFSIQATPTTLTNTITVVLVVHHANRDSCLVRFTYTCDPTPLLHCDDVKVKPFIFTGASVSGRTFTVYNLKVPVSPITSIDIVPAPTPCLLQGSGLLVDFVATSWSSPYTRIPVSGNISANTQVQFNLGIAYSCNWIGTVNLVIHHADGDSCIYTYGKWDAHKPNGGGVIVTTDTISHKIFVNKLQLRNTTGMKPVKWVSINVTDPTDLIIAGSGAQWEGAKLEPDYEKLDQYDQGMTEALYSFSREIPTGEISGYFNLVIGQQPDNAKYPVIQWTTYDGDGNALATDTVGITQRVLSISGESGSSFPADMQLLTLFPNPITQSTTINYLLGSEMNIRLEVYNQLGEYIATVEQGFRTRGVQSVHYNTSHLPAGTYYLRLSSANASTSKSMVIVR